MTNIVHLNEGNFAAEVRESELPVLVDFYADWCGPCRKLAPVIAELSRDYEGLVKVAKLDVDANPALASEFGVMSIPTVILFAAGQPVERLRGFQPKPHLKQQIDRTLAARAA